MTDPAQTILAFAAEQQLIEAAQLVPLTQITTPQAEQQLHALAREGLVRLHRGYDRQSVYCQITSRGLASIDSPLSEPRVETVRDDRVELAVGWLTLAARRGRFGDIDRALTRRVMRHHDTSRLHPTHQRRANRDGPPDEHPVYGVALGTGIDKTVARHYPDLLLLTHGWRVGFEIQIRQPPLRVLAQHITAYAADPDIGTAIYLTDSHEIGDTIIATADRLGLQESVRVQSINVGKPPPAPR
jgi:hypothetical protein